MQPLTSTSSAFLPASDGWFQVTPIGSFPHPSGVLQVIDQPALESIVNRFNTEAAQPNFSGLLVDFDHFSQDPHQPTAAAGWITKLDARPTGLWAQIRLSDLGQAALNGGRYRSLSPVWLSTDCEPTGAAEQKALRPLRLDRVALTNDPNLKGMAPLTNSASARQPAAVSRAAKARASISSTFSPGQSKPLAKTRLSVSTETTQNRTQIIAARTRRGQITK